ncbi:phytoene desaturase family protein [Streptomyces sp. NPDC002851]
MARIAVIGAGMGAMATAARLAVAGHRVVIFERAETYGGALGRYERDGFAFDTGPGLLPLPAVYRDLFIKTGKRPLEDCVDLVQVDPAVRHLFADGTEVDLPNASRAGAVAALDAALGTGAGERWGVVMNRARDAWERMRRPLLEEPLWPNWQVLGEREPYPAAVRRRLLRADRRARTLAEVGAWELADPRLAAILESHALAYGLDPRTAPANAAVLPYMEQSFGVWYVRGGLRELARAVYDRCRERKVEFTFGAEIVRIVEKDGRAAGVELADGTVEQADHVVAGCAPGTVTSLLPGHRVWRDVGPAAPQSGLPGRLTALLALRGARPEATPHRTVLHPADREDELDHLFPPEAPGAPDPRDPRGPRDPRRGAAVCAAPTLTVLRPDDPALVPDADHEAVTLTATVPPHGPVDWSDREAAAEAAERLLTVAERAIPGLRDRLLWHEVRTPVDIARTTCAEGGSVPAPALAAAEGRLLHPANSTRLPGLYLAGGWAHPGGGLAHAGMSGALVAGLIVEGAEFRGSQ